MCCLLQSPWRGLNVAKLSQMALSSCHPVLVNNKRLEVGVKRARLNQYGHVSQQNQAGIQASYMVVLRIAQQKKPHNIGEKLILPCCKDRCMIGDGAEMKLAPVPSNNTIQRRISEMAEDIKQRVVAEIQAAPLKMFAIQLDESTDVARCAQLLVFVSTSRIETSKKSSCFAMHWKLRTKEKMFSRKSTSSLKKGGCLRTMCGNSTNGAPAILGTHSGYQEKVKDTNPDTKHLHCMIHWCALASKTLPTELRAVLDEVIAMVIAIKASALSTRLFLLLC